MKREEKQKLKLIEMLKIEKELWAEVIDFIAGVDEVGRGPLAGPVVVAAVILPKDFDLIGVNDSKKVSEKRREELAPKIKEKAVAYSIGLIDHKRIDEINILNATKEAMTGCILDLNKKLIEQEGKEIDHLLIDALDLKNINIPISPIIKGDAKSVSIAAASIIAKVARDHIMIEYAKQYPGYSFETNKGYGTAAHYEGLNKLGLCPIHRRSFVKAYL